MKNQEIANILYEIAAYLDMEGVAFKPRAYEKAAHSIESLEEDVLSIYKRGGLKALGEIPGVGESIASKIEELLKTGRLKYFEGLKKKYPVAISELTSVEGIGPKMALKLYQKLKIKNLEDLEKAANLGKIRKIEGFGVKTEENILKGIKFVRQAGARFILGFILPQIREIEGRLNSLPGVKKVVVAGSVRRWKETIGDVDILIISENPEPVMDYFVSMPEVIRVYAHGKTKSMIRLKNGLDVDLRVVPPESFGAALNYFTGSKEHNVALRELALRRGWKLNEYGLFSGKKRIAGKTEEELYQKLGLKYIEPELRENTGEIAAARSGELPKVIGYHEIRGDLQIQTDWTDGLNSISEMAREASRLGREYIAITDHTKALAMTGGADEKKLLRQMAEIDKLNKELGGKPKILKGAEVNILKDGRLDIKDEVLAKLDVCGVAVHSHFNMSKKDMTERIKRAISSPHVDILFHPTGRLIQAREPYALDIDEIIKTAKKTGTILEIDCYPDRLDFKDEHIRKAVEARVKLSIDTDAHATSHLHYLELGIAQARRGWAQARDIINTRPLKAMLALLKNSHGRSPAQKES